MMELKILSWNIWVKGDLEKVVPFIKDSGADVVGLQEVIPEREPHLMDALQAFGYQGIFADAKWRHDEQAMGNAIFSKFPITHQEVYTLTEQLGDFPNSEGERRVAVSADIEVHGSPLSIFTTHLAHTHQQPSPRQRAQLEALIKVLPKVRTALMGDFNATPESDTIRRLEGVLTNTDPTGSPTWSVYPEGCKVCDPQAIDTRLDYIFTTPDLKTHSPKIERSDASDHLPITVDISTG